MPADSTYVVDELATGTVTVTVTDDGSGIDTLVIKGAYAEPTDLRLAWLTGLAGVPTQASGFYFSTGNTGHRLQVNGQIENATGGTGADYISGNILNNVLRGEAEDATQGGNDSLFGDDGNDTLYGGYGNDLLNGAEDDDLLFGGEGADTLSGALGNDTLHGGAGADSLSGGADGRDMLSYEGSTAGVTINLTFGDTTTGRGGHAEGDRINGIADVMGSDFGDTIVDTVKGTIASGYNANRFYGGAGADRLELGGGNDTGEGGSGRDTIYGENGNDSISGGEDADFLSGGEGDDTVLDGQGTANDTLYGDAGNDTLSDDGGDDLLDGGSGNDVLSGGAGADTLYGGAGQDQLRGGAGNDVFDDGPDNDVIDGGDGIDMLTRSFTAGGDQIFVYDLTLGYNYSAADPGSVGDRFTSIENLQLSGPMRFRLIGDTAANSLSSGGQNDTLDGRDGNDTLIGNGGNDILIGGAGNDSLIGGAGADRLFSGIGRDVMTGGGGADRFVFRTTTESFGANRDIITDFQRGIDKIDLATIDARTTAGGNQAFTFIGSRPFSDKAGELRATAPTGTVLVQADVNGDGRADFTLTLQNMTAALKVTDFIL